MRWKNFGETTTEEGHTVFFSGKEDKHEHGVGFLVQEVIMNTVMGCRPVSSRPTWLEPNFFLLVSGKKQTNMAEPREV